MSATADSPRFTLRDLPLPGKVVVTCFMLSIGLGYTSAMVQLHFQDSKSGQPMPTPEDVVLKFTGKKWFDVEPPRPVSKFVKLITAASGTFGSNGTMLPAFFEKDPSFNKALRGGGDETKLRGEREGERDALVAWAKASPEERKAAFENDSYGLAPDEMPRAITDKFKSGNAVKIKSIIEARCVSCHGKGGPQEGMPLETYAQIEKYLTTPTVAPFPPGGGYVRIEEPISLEKLTQSTHAHLLSFSVLFSLTGLVFAFTSYPTVVRCLVSPLVLVAIVTDVAFWWLARLSETYGVYFAMGVMGTGGIAGMGLGAQITLSLWNMYGPRGKAVILGIFAVGAVVFGLVFLNVVKPGLDAKKAEQEKIKAESDKKPEPKKDKEPTNQETPKSENGKKDPPTKEPDKKDPIDKKGTESPMPKLVAGSIMDRAMAFTSQGDSAKDLATVLALPFDKGEKKNMVRAFFDKDGDIFAAAVKNKDAAMQTAMLPERLGELESLRAWMKLPDADRMKTYNADAFPMPTELAKKPITADYVKNGNILIKAILTDRCIRCHADEPDIVFSDYTTLKTFLEPMPQK